MGDVSWPTVVALVVAVIGGMGGIAALMRSGADQSKTFSESAQIVVDIMKDTTKELAARLAATEERTTAIENELMAVQHWGNRVLDVLDRAIALIPTPAQTEFQAEAEKLREHKPHPKGYSRPGDRPPEAQPK